MLWIILLAGFAVVAFTAMPLGVGLGLIGLTILHFLADGAESLAIQSVWDLFTSFTMSAAPLYIFMGAILMHSGLSKMLYTAIAPLFERIPGKLLHSNIVVCTLFGSVSGTSMGTAAAVGSVAYPELRSRGYDIRSVVATLAAGGTLGLLIPPSLSLLIYGAFQGVSIGKLFLAGIVPGVMIALFFMAGILVNARVDPAVAPVDSPRIAPRQLVINLLKIWPLALLVFTVLGTIYLGIATPTESAGLGVLVAIVTGFAWGSLSLRKLWLAFYESVLSFGAIGVIVIGALMLAQSISVLGAPQEIMKAIVAWNMSPYMVLVIVCIIYIILGCLLDGISLMLMTLPIVYPVMTGVGFDPIWLGVIIVILIEIGQLTPPVGVNLFVLTAISRGEVSLGQAARASMPYWLLMVGAIVVLTVFPGIALFLPDLLG